MGGKNKTRRIRWKPVEIEDVFDISSSTTSEDMAELHDEEMNDESYHRKPSASVYSKHHHNGTAYRNIQQQHYHRPQRYNNSNPAYGGFYEGRKHESSANRQGNRAHSKSSDGPDAEINHNTNGFPSIPATGVYVNGLWIPASEVERIIVNGELPPPPYGPAIPPAIGQKNVYFYYGYIKKENNESHSERLRENSTACQGNEAAQGDGSAGGGSGTNGSQTNEDYIPVIYASSHAPPSRRPFRNTRIRRRRFLDNDYVDLESDNCDIITKVTPKNYHFILSLDKASGSELSDSATPPASSEDLEQDSSTDTFAVPTASPTPDGAEFEFGTISEIAKDAADVARSEQITADAMIEEFAQRAVSGIIDDALKQVKVDEEKNRELLNQPGCSGITPTELYAEKVARTIMGGVMVESNKRRPPPIVIEDSINANPSTGPSIDDQKRIRQHADQMATEILASVLHPANTKGRDDDAVQDTTAKDSPASRLSGVREVLKQGVRESGNFLGEGATSPDSGESSPRAPQQTTATTNQLPPPLPPPPLPPIQQLPNQSQEAQSECFPGSDRYPLGFPQDSSWASLNVPKSIEDKIQIDCGLRKSSDDLVEVSSGSPGSPEKASPIKAPDKAVIPPDSGIHSEIDDDEHVVFAVTVPKGVHSLNNDDSVVSECPSDSTPVYLNLAANVPFLAPQIRNFRPFGYCCTII